MGMTEDAKPELVDRKEGWPADYHDYVFKDGKFVGDFDNMYRHAKGIPWDQDTRCDHWYAQVGMFMLKAHAPYDSILEIGCGLGYIAAKLKALVGHANPCIDAFDVSPEAIRRARRLHPGIGFYVDNVADVPFRPRRQYGLVVIRDVFWYIFPQIRTVIRNVNACVRPQGLLYICQSFPALDDAFVGKDVLPNPDALMGHFSEYKLIYTAVLRNHELVKDGPILHFLARRVG